MSTRKSSVDRKAEIIAATLNLAFEVGPDHVTTGLVANRLGLTQPAIYKHFPRKQDIWLAAAELLCSRIAENTQKGTRTDIKPMENTRHLVLSHLRLIVDFPALPEIMVTRDPTGNLTEPRRQIQVAMAGFRVALTKSLGQATREGHLRKGLHTLDAVTLFFGIIQSLVLRLIITHDPSCLIKDGERLFDLQLTLFENQGTTQ